MMKRLLALLALTTLTACDYIARTEIRSERNDRIYQEAMADYRAGRMDAAVAGFEKAVRNDPANASARFQLACLHQDLKKDYLSAYCGYREFLVQHPESDRVKLAKDRLATCEKEMAKSLADKYGLGGTAAQKKESEGLRAELEAIREKLSATEKELEKSRAAEKSALSEKDRLLALIKGEDDAEEKDSGSLQAMLKEKDLLDEEDETSTGPSLIPVRKPEPPALTEETDGTTEKKAEKKSSDTPVPDRPSTYTVEDGDTLYGISKRFYGSIQHWKKIREANKALISSDNRLRAGDVLVLP